MKFLDFLRKNTDNSNKMEFAEKPSSSSSIEQEKFVADLSCMELQSADWVKFAGILKREGVLSNSYDKNPISIEYSLAKDNRPMVVLTFQSKTSYSVRKVELYQDVACLYVNGALEMNPETQRNKDLNRLWKDFQNELRYCSKMKTHQKARSQVRHGARLMIEAQKMLDMEDIYDREQQFLEKYKDDKFDYFCYSALFEKNRDGFINYAGELPQFIPLKETEDGYFISGEPVVPFSPRTLEHCILHMTNGQKIEDGKHLIDFEEKCRKLQKYSCFESEDWDKVIEFGKKIVRNQCILYMITHEMGE